jgi:oligopeptide/dipeptide ABC transporter ATP-binding protein
MNGPLVSVRELRVDLSLRSGLLGRTGGRLRAVDGVDFEIETGETLALVGESGCGKTTVGRALMGLVTPAEGRIEVAGRAPGARGAGDRRAYSRAVQMIFQDPVDALNPRRRVGTTLAQPLRLHDVVPRAQRRAEVERLLEVVGLTPPAEFAARLPRELSGGQRQRVAIARSIAVRPQLIVADEAVSALDVSVRAQVLRLLADLQAEFGLSYLFISHDLGVVRSIATRVAVMYLGQLVEVGPIDEVFTAPRHPYTKALIDASPVTDPGRGRARAIRRRTLEGDLPSPLEPPSGCRFRTRCPRARPGCEVVPGWTDAGRDGTHAFRCHFPLGDDPGRVAADEPMQIGRRKEG